MNHPIDFSVVQVFQRFYISLFSHYHSFLFIIIVINRLFICTNYFLLLLPFDPSIHILFRLVRMSQIMLWQQYHEILFLNSLICKSGHSSISNFFFIAFSWFVKMPNELLKVLLYGDIYVNGLAKYSKCVQ